MASARSMATLRIARKKPAQLRLSKSVGKYAKQAPRNLNLSNSRRMNERLEKIRIPLKTIEYNRRSDEARLRRRVERSAEPVVGAGYRRPVRFVTVKAEKIPKTAVSVAKPKVNRHGHGHRETPKVSVLERSASLKAIPYTSRNSVKSKIALHMSFESFGLLKPIQEAIISEALRGLSYIQPSAIQKIAIPPLLAPRNQKSDHPNSFLIASETGSGKTLAYLAPLLHHLKVEEQTENLANLRRSGSPRSIILVPSGELVSQISKLIKKMSHSAKISSFGVRRDMKHAVIIDNVLKKPIDVLVCTPHRLQSLITDGLRTSDVTHLVIDEADSLFDESFAPLVIPIIDRAIHLHRLVLCSATIPRALDSYLERYYPDIHRIVTPHLHAVPRRIQFEVIDATEGAYARRKENACLSCLREISNDKTEEGRVKRVMVFVNERTEAPKLAEWLKNKDQNAFAFTRDVDDRKDRMAEFLEDTSDDEKHGMKILVTTDLGSRGLDTINVKNVILFDTPHSSIDLLHRIGRTGRAGRRGRAFLIINNEKYGGSWVREIRNAVIRGQALI
ncbi:ATP-dependent RNA helicase mrh4, mitochondrial [Neolecta irregularis DAH-3]|uniref:RNA helicase n=1 Tax=Neolecta irregularis (strain DAH-3) TaxID=1198029 RepID=A0A1U7LMT4_NEOID|nr:ATP-dependent RNA helicase mrh4, mitochondrial [Neolecta irregularis DAH-3]|eukprot:OLL23965.1 ATP-dependent RNA helicase mrh4, mitochondrial [Neolecta irregularis DAH-3]